MPAEIGAGELIRGMHSTARKQTRLAAVSAASLAGRIW